jgi:transcriptional regulator with XRE-family HTH domain
MVLKKENSLKRCLAQSKESVATRLRQWMEKQGLNQAQLVIKTGMVQSVCCEIMRGGALPSCGTIQRMAEHTNINIELWLTGVKRVTRKKTKGGRTCKNRC